MNMDYYNSDVRIVVGHTAKRNYSLLTQYAEIPAFSSLQLMKYQINKVQIFLITDKLNNMPSRNKYEK